MKISMIKKLLGITLLMVSGFAMAASPVALLTQVKGTVEYSKDGETWKKVRRNKLLKSGYQLRSGADGAGLLVNQIAGTARSMGANSKVRILDEGVELISGSLSEAREGNDLMGNLKQRFAQVQRHTTVRRSVQKANVVADLRLSTAKRISLSAVYPELVWENVGVDYSYRVTIGESHYAVPAVAESIVRFTAPVQTAGEHDYMVEVMQGDKVLYTPRRPGTLKWLSSDESSTVEDGVAKVRQDLGDDDFFIATYLSDHGLEVPAMEHYRSYFSENMDNNDLRPLLIASYHTLKLKELRLKEAQRYNEELDE